MVDTARSLGCSSSPRDDRFHTPRTVARSNSINSTSNSDEWFSPRFETPRLSSTRGTPRSQYSDGEYGTPRDGERRDRREMYPSYPSFPPVHRSNSLGLDSPRGPYHDSPHLNRKSLNPMRAESQGPSHYAQTQGQGYGGQGQGSKEGDYYDSGPNQSPGRKAESKDSRDRDVGMSDRGAKGYADHADQADDQDGYPNNGHSGHGYSGPGPGTVNSGNSGYMHSGYGNPISEHKEGGNSGKSGESGNSHSEDGDHNSHYSELAASGLSERDVEDVFSYARHGRVEEIERLFTKGLPVDVRDAFGNTVNIVF
jgi:hypothetical protein